MKGLVSTVSTFIVVLLRSCCLWTKSTILGRGWISSIKSIQDFLNLPYTRKKYIHHPHLAFWQSYQLAHSPEFPQGLLLDICIVIYFSREPLLIPGSCKVANASSSDLVQKYTKGRLRQMVTIRQLLLATCGVTTSRLVRHSGLRCYEE